MRVITGDGLEATENISPSVNRRSFHTPRVVDNADWTNKITVAPFCDISLFFRLRSSYSMHLAHTTAGGAPSGRVTDLLPRNHPRPSATCGWPPSLPCTHHPSSRWISNRALIASTSSWYLPRRSYSFVAFSTSGERLNWQGGSSDPKVFDQRC